MKIAILIFAFCVIASMNCFAQQNSMTHDEGVIINGVRWATRNVDAPGTFTDKPEGAGMFYQWNQKKAWNANGEISGWNDDMPEGTEWDYRNDPSPAGWFVPSLEHIKSLLDTTKVNNEWVTQNGVKGRKFTDITTGNNIFLPAVGSRDIYDGALLYKDTVGFYWSSTRSDEFYACFMNVGLLDVTNDTVEWGDGSCSGGCSLRPVGMIVYAKISEVDDSMGRGKDVKVLEMNPYSWGNEQNAFKEVPKFMQSIEGRYRNADELINGLK